MMLFSDKFKQDTWWLFIFCCLLLSTLCYINLNDKKFYTQETYSCWEEQAKNNSINEQNFKSLQKEFFEMDKNLALCEQRNLLVEAFRNE